MSHWEASEEVQECTEEGVSSRLSSCCVRLPEARDKELGVGVRVEGVGMTLRSSRSGLLVNRCLMGVVVVVFGFFPPLRISFSGSLPLRRRSLERELFDSFESGSRVGEELFVRL